LVPTTSIFSDRTGNSVPGSRVERTVLGQVHPYRTISCHYENFPSEDAPVLSTGDDGQDRTHIYVPIIPMVLATIHRHWYGLPVVSILWTSSTTPEERTVRRTTTDDTQVSWIQRAITAIPDDNGNVQKWSSASSGAFEKAIEIIELPVGTWTKTTRRSWRQKSLKMVYSKLWTHTTRDRRQLQLPVCYRSRRD
jgi:hypothetical protein